MPGFWPFTLMEMRPSHGWDAEFESGSGFPHRLVRSGRKTRSAKASHAKQTRKYLSVSVPTPCWRDRNAPDWGTLTVSHRRSDTSQAPLTRRHGDQHIVEDRCLHHSQQSSSRKKLGRPDRVLEVVAMEVQTLCASYWGHIQQHREAVCRAVLV